RTGGRAGECAARRRPGGRRLPAWIAACDGPGRLRPDVAANPAAPPGRNLAGPPGGPAPAARPGPWGLLHVQCRLVRLNPVPHADNAALAGLPRRAAAVAGSRPDRVAEH